MIRVRCLRCGFTGEVHSNYCPRCGFPLITEPRDTLRIERDRPSIWRYSSVLNHGSRVMTLGEGFTRIRKINGILIKDESRNPTGSFMDRGSAIVMSNIIGGEVRVSFEEDFTLSLATYAKVAGVNVKVYVDPRVVAAYPELLRLVMMDNVTVEFRESLANSDIHYGDLLFLDGVKTIAYELYEQVGEVEGIVVPMERGYLALAIYEGFRELQEWGLVGDVPRFILVKYRASGTNDIANWLVSVGARVEDVEDTDITKGMIELAMSGLYVKPVSAMAYAAAKTLGRDYVVVITGTGIREYRIGRGYRGLTKLQEAIIKVLKVSGPLTAYEIWERLDGGVTIQGVYKSLNSLAKRGVISIDYEAHGNRKIRVYRLMNYK